ncbi:MAG: methyltransferase domain-containing protein [Betaproteobacteria bacterium]|nr:methyltransferase domain-containing protein [Betaproteobacteria bacterium]
MGGATASAGHRAWSDEIKERIRQRYSRLIEERDFPPGAARRILEAGYPPAVLDRLPEELIAAYRGCGFPLAGLRLAGVRFAVDLGCGAGIDAWWLASEMGPGATVVALDMTLPMLRMLSRARTRRSLSAGSVWPVAGDIEHVPLASGIAELVVANASFNLTVDKTAAFHEAYRILKPGGCLAVRELVREGELLREILEDPLADVTSLGGTVTEEGLRRAVADAGFTDVRITNQQPFSCVLSVQLNAVKPA